MASDACSSCLRSTGGTSGSVLTMRRSCVRSMSRQLSAHRPDVKGRARHDRPFAIKRTARYGPRGMAAFTRWIHLLGLATYFGTTLGLALQLLPAAEAIDDPALQRRLLARGLRPYNVLSIGALGVLVLSGASSLTEWKALLGRDFARLLWRLVAKLSLTFALILVATYVSFGLAHRLMRAELGQLPVDAPAQAGMIRRMRTGAWLGLALAAWTAWVGVGLTR